MRKKENLFLIEVLSSTKDIAPSDDRNCTDEIKFLDLCCFNVELASMEKKVLFKKRNVCFHILCTYFHTLRESRV